MKIIVPVKDRSLDGEISNSLSRSDYFCIWEDGELSFLENLAKKDASGAGVKAGQLMVDSGADILISKKCGEKAARVLEAADIKIYKSQGQGLRENLEKFKNGQLLILEERQTKTQGGQ